MKRLLLFVVGAVLVSFSFVQAADFPTKDLSGIIMWGAGGATDNVARAVTPLLERHLGKQIILQNKPGAVGAVATQWVQNQPSDGYTLLYGAENPQLYKVLDISQLDYKDFYSVNLLARGVGVFVVNNNTPWKTFKEFIDDAKKQPGMIKLGSTGPGGLTSVVGAMMKGVSGVTFTDIPFGGEGPGMTALQGGHVQGIAVGLTAGREHIRAGRVRPLALFSLEPIPGLEAVPLVVSMYPEYKKYLPWGPYYGIWVKKDVPDAAKKILVDAFQKGSNETKFRDFIKDFGAVYMGTYGEESDKFLTKMQSVTCWLMHEAGFTKASPEKFNIPRP
jgi:tripartite-type tricarboxylate transporter receptor subunit TctC